MDCACYCFGDFGSGYLSEELMEKHYRTLIASKGKYFPFYFGNCAYVRGYRSFGDDLVAIRKNRKNNKRWVYTAEFSPMLEKSMNKWKRKFLIGDTVMFDDNLYIVCSKYPKLRFKLWEDLCIQR